LLLAFGFLLFAFCLLPDIRTRMQRISADSFYSYFLLLPQKKSNPEKVGTSAEKSPLYEIHLKSASFAKLRKLGHHAVASDSPQFLTLIPRFSSREFHKAENIFSFTRCFLPG
jgi:hypothetical protein